MIETKAWTHTIRLFADSVKWTDIFRVVMYCSYRGDKKKIPCWFSIVKGMSAVTDLKMQMVDILGKMKSNTRNEIRRAEKEGCEFAINNDVAKFIPFYNAFCKSKGFPDYVSMGRLSKFKNLLITSVSHGGSILAMHATQLDPASKTALLILSGSQRLDAGVDKKMIGWGNRYLHYKDLELLKAQGYEVYDWSGVCMDPSDPRYSIGQFKLSFGGDVVDAWTLKSPMYRLLEAISGYAAYVRKHFVS